MKKGFTLAEVLITLAIIGVVAALTIPSVILNTNQAEYKTALKKAVSVLNQAVSLELALENVSPSETTSAADFLSHLQKQMNTVSTTTANDCGGLTLTDGSALTSITDYGKCSFTTTDGMQYIFANRASVASGVGTGAGSGMGISSVADNISSGACNSDHPCYLVVDVNGDKNPNKMTRDANAPTDRFIIMFKGDNGTTVTPGGFGAAVMFAK